MKRHDVPLPDLAEYPNEYVKFRDERNRGTEGIVPPMISYGRVRQPRNEGPTSTGQAWALALLRLTGGGVGVLAPEA